MVEAGVFGKSYGQVIDTGVSYAVEVSFEGANFQVLVNEISILTMPFGATPFGTVGFKVGTIGTFGFIQVQYNSDHIVTCF